jgi:hypothetical protein
MQLSYSLAPAQLLLGALADSRTFHHCKSRISTTSVKAGLGVFRVPSFGLQGSSNGIDPGQIWQVPNPLTAASATAILASGGASAASIQTIDTEANGTYATATLTPARQLTLVLSSHTDWDATTAVIRFYNQTGVLVSENLAIPNGGNVTVTTTGFASKFVDLTIPAQTGTGGTYTIGVAALDSSITLADFEGVAIREPAKVPAGSVPVAAYPGQPMGTYSADYHFAAQEAVGVLLKGAIVVSIEGTPSEGGDVFVRTVSGSGGSVIGTFRADADTSTAVQVTGARFGLVDTTNLLAVVEFF